MSEGVTHFPQTERPPSNLAFALFLDLCGKYALNEISSREAARRIDAFAERAAAEAKGWRHMTDAPRDETEILIRDAQGNRAIVAFAARGKLTGESDWIEVEEDGWFRRARGTWDLYDNFALQEEYPVEWMPLP